MNKVGMAVDVSHCGDRTTLDAFEISKKPVLITHSNCRALVPGHPRVKTDEAIKKMGAAGGVMGITGVRMFVKVDEPTTIEHVLDHFDHVEKLIGPEHLGVGSDIDLDGYDDMPPELNKQLRAGYKGSYGFREKIDIEGLNHPKRMFDLTEGLDPPQVQRRGDRRDSRRQFRASARADLDGLSPAGCIAAARCSFIITRLWRHNMRLRQIITLILTPAPVPDGHSVRVGAGSAAGGF